VTRTRGNLGKIAFISYEYPPDTAYGGIATYVNQAARMLVARGHRVEVFAGSPDREGVRTEEGVRVHRVRVPDQRSFAEPIGMSLAARHSIEKFDVLEGPDYARSPPARSRNSIRPQAAHLDRLLLKLNYYEGTFSRRVVAAARALRARQRPIWGYKHQFARIYRRALEADVVERVHALDSDEIAAPSHAIARAMIRSWRLAPERISLRSGGPRALESRLQRRPRGRTPGSELCPRYRASAGARTAAVPESRYGVVVSRDHSSLSAARRTPRQKA
jgi:hypothetical protein